jgi:hypothetical protein
MEAGLRPLVPHGLYPVLYTKIISLYPYSCPVKGSGIFFNTCEICCPPACCLKFTLLGQRCTLYQYSTVQHADALFLIYQTQTKMSRN